MLSLVKKIACLEQKISMLEACSLKNEDGELQELEEHDNQSFPPSLLHLHQQQVVQEQIVLLEELQEKEEVSEKYMTWQNW